jgi:hypothetical protein
MLTSQTVHIEAKGKVPSQTYELMSFVFKRECGHRHCGASYGDELRLRSVKEGVKGVPGTLKEYVEDAERWTQQNTLCTECTYPNRVRSVRNIQPIEEFEEVGVD